LADLQTQPAIAGRRMFSSLTGGRIDADELGASHWVRNLISPVLFADALEELVASEGHRREATVDLLVEIGPHAALKTPSKQVLEGAGFEGVEYLSVLQRDADSCETALKLAGELFIRGVDVRFDEVNLASGNDCQLLCHLPPYAWNHTKTFWNESRIARENRLRQHSRSSLLGAPYASFSQHGKLWRGFLRLSEEPWIQDHVVQSSILYPAAGFIAMVIEAARQVCSGEPSTYVLRDVQIKSALVLADKTDVECILEIRPHRHGTNVDDPTGGWSHFLISSSSGGADLREHCSGLFCVAYSDSETALETRARADEYKRVRELVQQQVNTEKFYDILDAVGLSYGSTFRNIDHIRVSDWQSCCTTTIPDIGSVQTNSGRPHVIHPAVLDSMFHVALGAIVGGQKKLRQGAVPNLIEEIAISADIPYCSGTTFEGMATARQHGFNAYTSDIDFLESSCEKSVVTVKGIRFAVIAVPDLKPNSQKSICSKVVCKPAARLLSGEQMKNYLEAAGADNARSQLQETIQSRLGEVSVASRSGKKSDFV